ncbi:MAG TPA: HD domain-containing phosphohydrolase [bacterium]|jgi:putative two-component system response regulator|nr:HD domain-containing phosphohydrolase [bacterium]
MRNQSKMQTVLVVDDEPDSLNALRQVMEGEGYHVLSAGDGVEALETVAAHDVDLVLLDLQMPRMNGEEACRRLKSDPHTRLIPVVMHTGVSALGSRLRAHEHDADDYLLKGSSIAELKARIRSLLRLKRYTDDLESAAAVLTTVARIVERRDHYVQEHCKEVSEICTKLGLRLGLDADTLSRLQLGATFHDIGKIVIEDAILQKKGPLDDAERRVMMTHAAIGSDLVEPMRSLSDVAPLIRHHHEKLDGTGYPDGLKDAQISLEVRVLTVADIFQALVSERPYKAAFPAEKAVSILRAEAAKGWWDTRVVEALAGLVGEGAVGRPATV